MRLPWKFLLMMMFAIWGVGLAMTVNGPDKGGTNYEEAKREGRGLFAPRVEYDEWTPLGHGDPLKNDPTYDYVPPVLERVRYWIEPSTPHRQPPPTVATLPHYRQPQPTATPPHHHHHHHQNTYQQRPPNTYARPPRPQAATSQYNSAERRDNHPFLTLVDGPKFNLPPSPPYKQAPPRQQYTRPPYRSPPPRPTFTFTTPLPTTEVTTTGAPSFSWSYQQMTTTTTTTTTTPASPIFLTPAESSAAPTTESPTPTPRPVASTSYTTSASLTTDPLFAHYKQPSEPLQGPMYLIIEGHSKVKTYGAGKQQPSGVSENSTRQKRRKRKRRRLRSFLYNLL